MNQTEGRSRSHIFISPLTTTGRFIQRHIWVRPLVVALILLVLGWWVNGLVEQTIREDMKADLTALIDADVKALRIWFKAQEANAKVIAGDQDVRKLVSKLVTTSKGSNVTRLKVVQSKELREFRSIMDTWLKNHGYPGFGVVDTQGRLIASERDDLILAKDVPLQPGLLAKVLDGKATVTRPAKGIMTEVQDGKPFRPAVMFAVAPIQDPKTQKVIAAIGLRIAPEKEFSEILEVARPGETGETYAFDANGLMLSSSRFDNELRGIGLLPYDTSAKSILNVWIKDPKVNLYQTRRPKDFSPDDLGLTKMAASATQGNDGIDVSGYRDYRGVQVIGVWRWLPDYGIGVATEMNVREAYRALTILRIIFGSLFALLVLLAVGILIYMFFVAKLQLSVRKATLEARQLGQYSLEEKLGEGGMGAVYKARHAMLRRPTAVKLLDVARTTPETIARFEREVQLTSQLNHPNTIAIYDFGRTPEGVFYYAMEYLDGLPLDALVGRFGPLPEGRVIHILLQACGSLNEAHGISLIHRDIKPANIMLNYRGAVADVVKVLDFGLVKAIDSKKEVSLTAANTITGTPQYLSPEGIERPSEVDARSDLYALGAVGYFLVTGTPVFQGESLLEVCHQQLNKTPDKPAARLGRRVSNDLETVLLQCLAKKKEDRPSSAQELATLLAACSDATSWTAQDAEAWWQAHGQKNLPTNSSSPVSQAAASDATVVFQGDIDQSS